MKGNTIALALLMCFVLLLAGSVVASASDFPTFQHDNNFTGVTTDSAPTSGATLGWSVDVGPGWVGFDGAPVVGGDKVFGVYMNGSVWAFNKTTGAVAWCNKTIGTDGSFELATPVYHDGALYVALSKGNASTTTGIHAFWANNGTVKWTRPNICNEQTNTPVIYDNDRVYFGTVNMTGVNNSDKGSYYCYDAETGQQIWKRDTTTGGGYYWAGALIIGDYMIYGDDKSRLVCINKYYESGNTTHWTLNVSQTFGVDAKEIRSSIAYNAATGRLYFTSKGGYCFAIKFDPSTGQFTTGGDNSWCSNIGYSTSTPAVYDGRVFVGLGGMYGGSGFCILNEDDGTPVGTTIPTNGPVQASPVISVQGDSYYVYFTTNAASGRLYCVDNNLNSWYVQPTGATYTLQGVAISDGYVYFGNDYGYMYGYH